MLFPLRVGRAYHMTDWITRDILYQRRKRDKEKTDEKEDTLPMRLTVLAYLDYWGYGDYWGHDAVTHV